MSTATAPRRRATELCVVLNQLWWDILAGDGLLQALEDYNVPIRQGGHLLAVQRMVLCHLALVLAKLREVHEHYVQHMPAACQDVSRALFAECERRGVLDFRNRVVGHVWDKRARRPLTTEEVQDAFDRLIAFSAESVPKADHDRLRGEATVRFYAWMRNASNPGAKDTVMGQLHDLRDAVMREHGLCAEDLGLVPTPRPGA